MTLPLLKQSILQNYLATYFWVVHDVDECQRYDGGFFKLHSAKRIAREINELEMIFCLHFHREFSYLWEV